MAMQYKQQLLSSKLKKQKGNKMKKLLNLAALSNAEMKCVKGGVNEGGKCTSGGAYITCSDNSGTVFGDVHNVHVVEAEHHTASPK